MKTKNRNKTAQKQKLKRRQRNGFRNKTKKLRSKKQYSRQRFLQMGGGLLENVVRMIMTPLDSGHEMLTLDQRLQVIIRRIGNVKGIFISNPDFDFTGNTEPGEGNLNGNTLLYAVCRMRPFTEEVSSFVRYLAERCHVNNVGNRVDMSQPLHGLVENLKDSLSDLTLNSSQSCLEIKWIEASMKTLIYFGADMTLKNIDGHTALEYFVREDVRTMLLRHQPILFDCKGPAMNPSMNITIDEYLSNLTGLLTPPSVPSPQPLIISSSELERDIGFITPIIDDIREPLHNDKYYSSKDENQQPVLCTWYFISGNFRYHFKKAVFDLFQTEYNQAVNYPDKIRGNSRLNNFHINSPISKLVYNYLNFHVIAFDTLEETRRKLLPTEGFESREQRDGVTGSQTGWIQFEIREKKQLYPLYRIVKYIIPSPPLFP
jgi:hypothetical protein